MLRRRRRTAVALLKNTPTLPRGRSLITFLYINNVEKHIKLSPFGRVGVGVPWFVFGSLLPRYRHVLQLDERREVVVI